MALISQAQNIRQFVTTHLTDVIDPTRHFRDDPDRATTGDQAFAVIRTPFNSYQLSVASAYVTPPAGAPLECKSLGTITFLHSATGQRIVGPKADKTWRDISKIIHEAELTDGLADAKRALAEAAPHEVAGCRVKLAELAELAKKWGIEAKVPVFPNDPAGPGLVHQSEIANPAGVPSALAAFGAQPAAINGMGETYQGFSYTPPVEVLRDPNAPAPYIGAPIIYITNPGEQISGMQEIPGHVVKVHSPDRITVCITPDTSEICYKTNLPRRGSDAGNGHVHKYNCWDFNPGWLAERERIARLEDDLEFFKEEYERLKEWTSSAESRLQGIVAELDRRAESAAKDKPRRGRPPKVETVAELQKPADDEVEDIAEARERQEAAGEVEGAELASELDPPKKGEQAA